MKDLILSIVSSELFWGSAAGLLGALIAYLRKQRKDNAAEDAIHFASEALKQIAPHTANTWDDKLALFLAKVDERLQGEHNLTLTPKVEEKAKEVFNQLYGDAPVKE